MNAKPRIWIINQWLPPDPAPTAVLCGELIDLLLTEGYELVLLSRARGPHDAALQMPGIERIVVDHLASGPTGILAKLALWPRFAWSAWRALRSGLKSNDIVVVCSDPPLFYPLAIQAAGRVGARVIHWSQDVYPDVVQRYWPSRWLALALAPLRFWRNAALRRANQVVVISEGMGQLMRSAGAHTTLIPNWARDDRLKSKPLGESALRRKHFKSDEFVLAYSGNLGRVHDFDTLIAAAHALRTNTQIKFLIIGSGPRLSLLQSVVDLERLDSFTFLPLQPEAELNDTLAAGDMHLVSLRPDFEGLVLPSKLYSIAAVGRGVLFCGDPEGESARMVTENGSGLAVAQGQGAELARAIQLMANDRERCMQMGVRARRLIDGELSRTAALARWRGLIAEVAG